MGSRVRLRGRNAVRGQHARRWIREQIGESRARYGDQVVAVGAAALAEEQQSLGVAGTAERHVVDEALSRLMPQIHRPLFRRRGNVLLIDSGSIALNPRSVHLVARSPDCPPNWKGLSGSILGSTMRCIAEFHGFGRETIGVDIGAN